MIGGRNISDILLNNGIKFLLGRAKQDISRLLTPADPRAGAAGPAAAQDRGLRALLWNARYVFGLILPKIWISRGVFAPVRQEWPARPACWGAHPYAR